MNLIEFLTYLASWWLIVILVFAIYFAPWLVANKRRHMNASAIGVLNLCLGWTFLGWVAALVWAMTNNVAPPPMQVLPPEEEVS
jgi:uncharacterized membrane protein